jgi:hypothetical protein
MTQRYAYLLFLICFASLAAVPARLEAQERQPYSIDQIIELIDSGVFAETRILMLVRESCIGFRLDEDATRRLSGAGASAELIGGFRDVCVRGFIETVLVTPAELDMEVGATRILRAQAMAPDSAQITGIVFEWTSADTAVAEVSGGGTVLAKAPGVVRIAATTQEGPSGTALVRVGVAGAEAEAEGGEIPETGAAGGKSVGTAAALGVVVPGGGEFYTGNTGKGAVVLAGSAAALAAGYFITSEEVLSVSYSATDPGTCAPEGTPCSFDVTRSEQVKTTNNLIYGAAAAGALWLYGLIDGIRSAKKSQVAPAEEQSGDNPGISLEIAPADGVRYTAFGEVELTLIRIRS